MNGVTAIQRDQLAIARVSARKGQLPALMKRVRDRYGIELPSGPRRVHAAAVAFIGVGVGVWLASLEAGADVASLNGFGASLRSFLAGTASVSDQIGSYLILRLTGPRVREALAKLVPLDLHPRAFAPGGAASTIASHVPLTLWRLDDESGSAVFELAVPRSYSGSFGHAIAESAAEFGFVRSPAG